MRYKLVLSREDGTALSAIMIENSKLFSDSRIVKELLKRMKEAVDKQ